MHSLIRSHLFRDHGRRRFIAPIASALLCLSICGVTAASMAATSAAQTPETPKTLVLNLSPEQVGKLELGSLGLSSLELTKLLDGLPGLGGSGGTLGTLVNQLLATPGETVQQLLEALKLGGALTPQEVIGKVAEGATNPAALTGLLSGIAKVLSTEQLGELQQIIERLLGSLSPAQLEQIEEALGTTGSIPALATGLIDELLGGGPQTAVETLLGNLGKLLSVTGSEAAEVAGIPLEELAKLLGTSTKSLTEVTGVVGTLPTKELLSILTGSSGKGLTVGVTPPGGSGASTNTTSTTTNTYTTNNPKSSKVTGKAGKVAIVSDKVIGNVLDLVVRAPSAGKLTVKASHMKSAHRRVGRARTVTFKLHLKRSAAAGLRRKPRRSLKVKVKASFTPKSGSRSSATASVTFG